MFSLTAEPSWSTSAISAGQSHTAAPRRQGGQAGPGYECCMARIYTAISGQVNQMNFDENEVRFIYGWQ